MERETLRGLGFLSFMGQMAMIMVISVGGGFYFGRLLDGFFQTGLLFTLGLLPLGAAGGVMALYRLVERLNRSQKRRRG
ncbi:MAG: AtpZ/AtpI family protein [Limnochordia bacterium]|jgi:F0F1-type ATP synthase assembly protein I